MQYKIKSKNSEKKSKYMNQWTQKLRPNLFGILLNG